MKLVTVIIKPFKLEDVREALSSIGIQGLTVTEVKGFGRQKGHAELYRGAEYSVNFLPKVKIDVAIADDQLDEVIDIVSKAAYTGKIGDGKIFVYDVENVVKVRTGEEGYDASFVFVPAKPTKRRCNLWHTATGTKNEDSDDKNWACFTGDAAGTGNGCTCGGR